MVIGILVLICGSYVFEAVGYWLCTVGLLLLENLKHKTYVILIVSHC